MPKHIVGRTAERQILTAALESPEAELVALYGRRRVGKTYLIRGHYERNLVFELSGVFEAPMRHQLENFSHQLKLSLQSHVAPKVPSAWPEAFRMLAETLDRFIATSKDKVVVFLDELPWLSTPRSNFLPALEHFWNSWGSRQNKLILVICGSAASWMIRNVIKARGGLHNRVTRRIQLLPFNLAETNAFLHHRHIHLDTYQIMEIYMAMGGIPHYLKEIQRGDSAAKCIDRICFSSDGLLRDEFGILYRSLFDNPDRHEKVIRALAKRHRGLTRQELLEATKWPTGGNISSLLEELEVCGFITQTSPFGHRKKDALYRLQDEYSLFFLDWIEKHRGHSKNVWLTRRGTPAWRTWSGYAFETMCLRHVDHIKRQLGISGIETSEASWHHKGNASSPGAQIDLLIDRKDMCINLCEMKHSETPFVIDKKYAETLRTRAKVFVDVTGTKKTPFITMVTSAGLKANEHSASVVDAEVTAQAFFTHA